MGQKQVFQLLHLLRGEPQQLPHRIADLAALDAVFEAVLVNGGEPVGGADKLHYRLLFTGAGLEPGGVAYLEEHLAAKAPPALLQLGLWLARCHGAAIGLAVGADPLGLAGAQGAGHLARQLTAGGGFHAGKQAIGPMGQAVQVVGGHG